MFRIRNVVLVLATAAVAACSVDPNAAYDRRQKLIVDMFPEAQDRQGIHLAYAVSNSAFELAYFPDEVRQSVVDRRANKLCGRLGNASKANYATEPKAYMTGELPDGTSRKAIKTWYKCAPKQ
jgi:hypothetical protein